MAKNKKIDLQLQNLNNIVYKIVPLLQAGASITDKHIFLELHPIPDFWVDEKEVSQLIINLVCNALEVTPTGGNVTIKTSQENDVVMLSVIDQGSGIPPEIIEKLGTPFLTTKEHGTGLGLAICYSIAARHDAVINVSSDASGTIFSVTFTKI
ncbi:MAG: HAMP domain-containing sensor histidine kinase [Thermincola sp.]|nr:HAMP domain-containing sensor histidine kinase [Thermincola sp.]MDT3704674.1 HAMP domain-containing sensor histidine kinase [Thermincola sp.]